MGHAPLGRTTPFGQARSQAREGRAQVVLLSQEGGLPGGKRAGRSRLPEEGGLQSKLGPRRLAQDTGILAVVTVVGISGCESTAAGHSSHGT